MAESNDLNAVPPPPANPGLALSQSVLEGMAEGVLIIRDDGWLLAANESASRLLGLAAGELPCAEFARRWPLLRADGTPYALEENPFQSAFREEAARQSLLLGVVRPDGARRWLSCGLHLLPAARPGEPRLLIAVFEVLAAARQADIELRAVTDFSPVGVFLQDAEGNCLYVNHRWEELIGLTCAEARGRGWMRLIHPEDMAAASTAWEAAARAGEPFHSDLRVVRPDGQVVWVSVRAGRVDMADDALKGYAGTMIDINARKRAEAALAASEQRLRACIESSPNVAVQWFDAGGRVMYWNPASELIYGWPAAEAVGRTLDQLILTPDDTEEFLNVLHTVAATQTAHGPAEYQFHRRDGTPGTCLSTVFGIPAEDGEPRFVSMDVDITQRQRAERLLVGQASILELISYGAPLADVLEQTAKFIELNAPGLLCSILRLDADGVTLRQGAAPSLPADYNRAIDGVRSGEGVGSCGTCAARRAEVVVADIASDPLWQDYRSLALAFGLRACWSTPILSASGELFGTFACYHRERHEPTSTERRLVELGASLACTALARHRAQQELHASEQRLRLLVDNSQDIVVELLLPGEVSYASANMSSHLGLAEADLTPARLLERVHPDDRVVVFSALRQPHGQVSFRFRRGAGEWRWFEAWGRRFTAPDRQEHAVIFARDVTERKAAEAAQAQLEAQLRQSQRLEAIGTLAGGVAHDFNNILAGILGHVELIALDLPVDSPMKESVRQIQRGTLRARDLVRRILTFSRGNEICRAAMLLSAAVKEALLLLRASIPSNIEFVTGWPEAEPQIHADAGQIHQIIMNVSSNAARAIGSRPGRLAVSVAVVELEESFTDGHPPLLPGRHVRLTMADDGCGMSAEVRQRIFDPFFTTQPTGQGTGLGLAMVHGIVQMHQAAVTVTSEPGAGARFDFFFRALETADANDPAEEQRLSLGAGEHLLVVDDEESVLCAARSFLERLQYRVTACERAAEALELVARAPHEVDAVLTDLTMPQLNGLELARRLSALRADLPVVLMSGYMLGVEDQELSAAGVVRVVQKPFSMHGLAEVVSAALRHRKAGATGLNPKSVVV